MKDVYILAIESSCDETAAAVLSIENNKMTVMSNVVSSQISIHALYGGVVPEIASRRHVEAISGVVKNALSEANCSLDDIDAIAVTYAPGLIGALLVGVNYAKGLSFATGKPLVSRSMTIDGSAIKTPKNVRVPIGTMMDYIVDYCGGFVEEPEKIVYRPEDPGPSAAADPGDRR